MNTTQANVQPVYYSGQPVAYQGQQQTFYNNRPGAAYGSVPQPRMPGQAGVPSNDALLQKLDKGQATLQALEGRTPDPSSKQVVQDLQRIVQDNKELLMTVNSGNNAQNLVKHGWALMKEMQGNEGLTSLFRNWRNIASGSAGSSDLEGLMNMGGGFLSSIRDTQEFFELLAELVALLRVGVTEATTQFAGETGQPLNAGSQAGGFGQTNQSAAFGQPQYSHPVPPYGATQQHPTQVLPTSGSSNVTGNQLANAASSTAQGIQQSAQSGQINSQVHRVTEEVKKILTLLAYNPTYHRIIEHGRYAADGANGTAQAHQPEASSAKNQVLESENLHAFADELEITLQALAGNQADVGLLFEATKYSLQDFVHNQRLQAILHELKIIADQSADNPALLTTPAADAKFKSLGNELQAVLHELRDDENVITAQQESSKLLSAIAGHPVANRLATDLKQLVHDIGGEEGQVIDPQILNSLRQVLVPVLLDQLNNVPLPPMAGEAKMLGRTQYELSNMTISVPALVPDNVYVRFEHEMNASVQHMSASQQRTYVEIFARDVQVHMQNIQFAYHRLTIPKTSDRGLLSVDTRGHGISIRLRLEITADLQNNHVLNFVSSHTTIDSLALRFHQSKHDRMYTRLSDTFSGRIKRQITQSVDSKVPQFAQKINDQLIPILIQARDKTGGLKGVTGMLMNKGKELAGNAMHGQGEGGAQGVAKAVPFAGKQAVSGLQKLEDKLRHTAETKESIAHIDPATSGVPAMIPVAGVPQSNIYDNRGAPQVGFTAPVQPNATSFIPQTIPSGNLPQVATNVHYETRPPASSHISQSLVVPQPGQAAVISSTPMPATYDGNYGEQPGVYTVGPDGQRTYAGPLPDQYRNLDATGLAGALGQTSLHKTG